MAFTKELVKELCEEAIELRKKIVEMRAYCDAINTYASVKYMGDNELLKLVDLLYREAMIIPDGIARETRATIMAHWASNERKTRHRKRKQIQRQVDKESIEGLEEYSEEYKELMEGLGESKEELEEKRKKFIEDFKKEREKYRKAPDNGEEAANIPYEEGKDFL
jgi:gas vesicle protein